MSEDRKIQKIALLVSVAAILQIAESFFPQVVPGVKLGLANMIVLIALVNIGFRAAIEIAIMRTLISSLILGTFLSPGFLLSFSSAITSTLVMGALYRLSLGSKRVFLSLIGISIIGAITHNLTQLSLVYLLLIKNTGVFLLLPWLGISSVIMGWVTGIVASQACERLGKAGNKKQASAGLLAGMGPSGAPVFTIGRYIKKESPAHALAAEIKILAIMALAVFVIVVNNFYAYAAVLAALLAAAHASKIPVARFFDGVKRLYFFIILSFALPVLFTTGGHAVLTAGIISVTKEGIASGFLFAFRLVLLMTGAAVLIRTTSPAELAGGIRKILKPLGFTGISGDRVAKIVTSSLLAMPLLWERAQAHLKNLKLSKRRPGEILTALSGLIVMLYLKTDEEIIL
jgi:heptaprenyl diphosphate synthase